jgi:hypothetical protein
MIDFFLHPSHSYIVQFSNNVHAFGDRMVFWQENTDSETTRRKNLMLGWWTWIIFVVFTAVNFHIAVFWYSALFGRRRRAVSILYSEDRGRRFSQIYLCRYIYICTYSECVSVASGIQHAERFRRIILSSVACPALQYLYTLPRIRHDFKETFKDHRVYVLIWANLNKNVDWLIGTRHSCQILIKL